MKASRYNVWVDRGPDRFVYNGLSGAVLGMRAEDRAAVDAFLAGDDDAPCAPELKLRLVEGRMAIAEHRDELEILARRYASSRRSTDQLTLGIVTSLGCNFDCPYCYEAKRPSLLHPRVQSAILSYLSDRLDTLRSFSVLWFGGEPLVGKRALLELSDEFISRCDASGVEYTADIVTNGSLLTEAVCRELADRRVTSVQVTLDGPPAVHDRMRPMANGGPTFERIVANLHHAVEHFNVTIRVNADRENADSLEPLVELLAAEGFAGRLSLYLGQIVGIDGGTGSPSASYGAVRCFTSPEFARAALEFGDLIARYGFGTGSLPSPVATPCVAVRHADMVVGSMGELYKCFESVGNHAEAIGHIADYTEPGSRVERWLKYDPFSDEECRDCIALPVCMGGCAHRAMDTSQYPNRCTPFRFTYREQVERFVDVAAAGGVTQAAPLPGRGAERAR